MKYKHRLVDAEDELADLRAKFDESYRFDFHTIYIARILEIVSINYVVYRMPVIYNQRHFMKLPYVVMRTFLAMCRDVLELSEAIKDKGEEADSYISKIEVFCLCYVLQFYYYAFFVVTPI